MVERKLPARQRVDSLVGNGNRLTADQRAHAARQEHTRQRGDKRRHIQVVDGRAHQKAKAHADDQRKADADERVNAQDGIAIGNEHARERGHRRHRQVDAAGDEHHRHAYGADADIGIVRKEQQERAQRCEALVAVCNGTDQIDDQEHGHRGVYHDVLGVEYARDETSALWLRIKHVLPPLQRFCGPWNASPSSCAPARTATR